MLQRFGFQFVPRAYFEHCPEAIAIYDTGCPKLAVNFARLLPDCLAVSAPDCDWVGGSFAQYWRTESEFPRQLLQATRNLWRIQDPVITARYVHEDFKTYFRGQCARLRSTATEGDRPWHWLPEVSD